MAKIKGWKKQFDGSNSLGKSERWKNKVTQRRIYLYGSVGQQGLKQNTLIIAGLNDDKTYVSSDRESLKKKATAYMRSHPNG